MRKELAPNDDTAQLRALETEFAAAMRNKDLDAVMAVYAPGDELFVFDVVGPPSAHCGFEAYRKAWEHFFASLSGPLGFTVNDIHVETSGDIAYGRSLQHVSAVRAKDGRPFDYTVRVTDVYRKIAGKWLIVQEHASFPTDRRTFTPILT